MNDRAPPPPTDAAAFRSALGAFVTGVTIVTTRDRDGSYAGLTANSFNSVSLDPPMVLWSLALDSTSLDAFRQAEWWAVHILAADQQALSAQFASKSGDKFLGVGVAGGPGGIPLLEGCAARFVCRAAYEYEGGDHAIFVGEVREFDRAGRPPLIYHEGRYASMLPRGGAQMSASTLESLQAQGLVDEQAGLTEKGRTLVSQLLAVAQASAK